MIFSPNTGLKQHQNEYMTPGQTIPLNLYWFTFTPFSCLPDELHKCVFPAGNIKDGCDM